MAKTQQEREALEATAEQLRWLDRLCENADFQRFTQQVLMRTVEENAAAALNLRFTVENRNEFAQRHDVAQFLARFAEKQRSDCRELLKASDEKRPAPNAL
jgi:hypothetical protein